VACRIDRNAVALVAVRAGAGAAEVGAVNQDGVDYEGLGVVIGSDREADGVFREELEGALDGVPMAALLLIDDRFVEGS
jgi:hypothetical protein